MQNSVAKKIFALGSAAAMTLALVAPFAAHAAVHAAGTNVSSSDGTVWMIMPDGTRRAYTSAGAFLSYGFNSWSQVVPASAEDLALTAGSFIPPQDGSIICSDRGNDKGTCYEISGGQKFGFTSAAVFTGAGFSFTNSMMGDVSWMTMNPTLLNNTTAAHLPGTLVNNKGTVQLMGNSGLLGIPDVATFNSWGYSFKKVVPANAADQAMTQTGVMATRVAGQLSPTALASNPTCTSNCTPVVNGSVSTSLSSDTPASGTIVAGQAIADLAHFTFTGSGTVTQVILKRIGVSADTTLANVYLYNGNTKITDAGSVSNGQVTFTNASGLFTVSGSMTISVKSDITKNISGQTVGMQLASFTVASGTPMTTSISGNLFTVANPTDLATVQLTNAGSITGPGDVNAGTMNVNLWGGNLSVGQRTVQLKYLNFKQIGSIASNAIQNLKLYVDGAAVGNTASINGNNVAFDMTGSPLALTTGGHTLELHGDVVAGSSYTFDFSLQTPSDIVLLDTSYNVNILLTDTSGNQIFSQSPAVSTIKGGSLSFQQDAAFNSTQFVKNSSQVTLGQWTVKSYGENVRVQTLKVRLAYTGSIAQSEGFNNLALYVNGGMVGSSLSAVQGSATSSPVDYNFGSTNLFTIPAGTTVTIAVKGDNTLLSNSNVTAVQATLITPTNSLQGVTSYKLSGTGEPYTANTLSVVSSGGTLAKNSAITNQTVSSNTTNQKIGSFVVQASNADGVRVTSLTVGVNGTMTTPTMNLTNLYIVTPAGNTTPVNPSASNNFSVNFTVPANQTATVDVFADVTNATGSASTTLYGLGTGVTSTQPVYLTSTQSAPTGNPVTNVVVGQDISVANGTLTTPTLQTSSPVSQFVIGASTNQPVATFNFVGTNGGATIQELDFFASSTVSGAITSVTVGGVTSSIVGSTSTVTGLNIAVPSNFSGVDVPVTVSYAPVGQNGINPANQPVQLVLRRVKYLSGSTTSYLPGPGSNVYSNMQSSNVMDLVGSAPTVTLTASNNTLTSNATVGSITIAANAAGNVIASTVPFTISANNVSSVSGNFQLIDQSSGVIAGTATFATTTTGSPLVINLTTDNNIAAGTSKTYNIVIGTVNTVANANNFSVTVGLGDAASFKFKDVNGNAVDVPGKANGATFIVNYPTNTVTSHQ